jgi:hypothetical protein
MDIWVLKEADMQGQVYPHRFLTICAAGFFFLSAVGLHGQETRFSASPSASPADSAAEVQALSELVRGLQVQLQALHTQVGDLRMEQERASEEARDLRRELDLLKAGAAPAAKESAEKPASPVPLASPQTLTVGDRISKLEEAQQVMEGKIDDQYQSKVESGSKYRLRLSGIVLLNLYENRGTVDNQDFPQLAEFPQSDPLYASPGAFGGSLRQSQIRLETFGPDIAGAHTRADVEFDFAGGFPNYANGTTMGLVRLRTGTVRLEWANTSVVAGQDRLFFAPLAPTSLATLATPALSYAGDLWAWTPQVRVEHRIILSDASSLSFQGGILDSLTGDTPPEMSDRYSSWGEQSGQPAYAVRISWSRRMWGQNMTVGTGGYYGRQDWGFGRTVDGWVGTADLSLPLGKRFAFTGAFYRGRAAGGFGGGIGQSVLLNGSIDSPATTFRGLDSMGGWAQLKFTPKSNFEINGALGLDNPYAGELRLYNSNTIYPGSYTRNLSPLVNFIYQVRSDILISAEYRHLNSTVLDSGSASASHVNLSLGYIF